MSRFFVLFACSGLVCVFAFLAFVWRFFRRCSVFSRLSRFVYRFRVSFLAMFLAFVYFTAFRVFRVFRVLVSAGGRGCGGSRQVQGLGFRLWP